MFLDGRSTKFARRQPSGISSFRFAGNRRRRINVPPCKIWISVLPRSENVVISTTIKRNPVDSWARTMRLGNARTFAYFLIEFYFLRLHLEIVKGIRGINLTSLNFSYGEWTSFSIGRYTDSIFEMKHAAIKSIEERLMSLGLCNSLEKLRNRTLFEIFIRDLWVLEF